MKNRSNRIALAGFALLSLLLVAAAPVATAQVSLTTLGSPYSQSFDTLAQSGTTNPWSDNTTIAGWYAQFSAVPANPTVYTGATGSSATGALYSFGIAGVNPVSDRALGSVGSGTPGDIFWAVRFTNNTGSTVTSLTVSYTGEEWRQGGCTPTPCTPAAQLVDFQYQVANAGVITDANTPTGSWLDHDALDFNTPQPGTSTAAAIDGNAAANRTALSSTITVSVAPGQEIWLRWKDINHANNDHGLAIDDLSVTPNGAAPNTPPTITPPANPITTVAQNAAPFTVNLSGSDDGAIYNWSATPGTGVASVNVTAGQGTNTVTYTVTLTAGFNGTATFTANLTDNVNTPATQAVNITVVAPPAAPTGLAAAAGTGHVALTWNTSGGATTYNVKRSTVSGSGYTTVGTPGTNSFDDATTVDGTAYFYVVSGVGAGGEGANSTEVTATSMAAPTGLNATPGNSHVLLGWNAVAGATGYNVKRSTVSGSGYSTVGTPGTNSFDDVTAVNGTTYYYVVTATNANGESVNSSEVSGLPAAPGILVISQVYGGAGCGTAGCSTFKNDYIEIFNRGGSPVSVNGWSVQYAAATGTTWQVTNLPNVSIGPGQYFLVGEGAGANGVNNIPAPDATGTIAMSATAAKVALVSSTVALSGACPGGFIDQIGYGATANCSEGGNPAPAPSVTNADLRNGGGCTDTNNNLADFTAAAAAPRNSASPPHSCSGGNTPPVITPPSNPAATVPQDSAPFPINLSGSDDGGIYNWTATPGAGISSVNVTGGQGTPSVTYTVSLIAAFNGPASFTATLSDNVNPPVNQTVNITVTPPPPPGAPTGLVATPGNAHVLLNWNAVGGATSYTVKRGTAPGGPYGTTFPAPATSYDDVTAVNGTTYYYIVTANGPGGESAPSNEASATPLAAPPPPTGLNATPGDSHVLLGWNAAPGATSYTVKRGTAPGGPYGTTFPGLVTTSYDDVTAVNGTTYYYVVTATNGSGESGNSNEVAATPAGALTAPTNLAAMVGDTAVFLNWTGVAGATSYKVKRGTAPGGPYTIVGSPTASPFTDSTVTNAVTYYYVVAGFNGAEGPISSEVTATPNVPAALGVVISQVYGGGGNAGATLKNDFVELFNRGTQTVNLNGWNVHYASATATVWTATSSPTPLVGSIAPGQHYLVQELAGAGGTVNLPTPDATGTIAMGATAGKIALVGSAVALTGQCPTGTFIADFVGYGPTANCFEGAGPTAATANTTAALRNANGCNETNNNGADFTVGAPNPRNSAAPVVNCGIVNNPPTITPPANPITTVVQDSVPFTVSLTGSDDGGVYTWAATPGTGISAVNVTAGQGTANVQYTVTLVAGFTGTATFTASLSDLVNPPATQTVNILVTPSGGGNNPPTITPPANPIATVAQDVAPFTVSLSGSDDAGVYNWSATPGTGIAAVNVTGGQGTGNVTYTVTLNAGFNGGATFTATLSDNVNPPVNQTVHITVTPAAGPPNHLVISQVYGGGGNSGATYQNDYVELYNPTASPVNVTGWTIQYSSATNTGPASGVQPICGTIGPGQYYLIGLASGGAVGAPLPPVNVSGGINMSGTTGKVALVSNGDPITGVCPAPVNDPDVVDFVGYGTANCNEGGSNAPAPSNTTSIFRKGSGTIDTNNNLNDFITGAPNPRSTTPLGECGPAIINTDPFANSTTVPRDASIIVSFTEQVDVDPGWYDITCTSTGNHNDATTAPGAPESWVIIPNTNFLAGESCTATVFGNLVHDHDTDDSGPGTDTLSGNFSWTFTISTGTAPPYPSSVHLTFGNPSGAVANPVTSPNNYLMDKPEFSISYNRDRGTPNWVSWHLTDEWIGTLTRVDTFRPDPAVLPTWYRVLASDYFNSGFDRGHMTPNADRDKETSIPINQATFLMSNMVPQAPDNNQGPWADLENYLRTLLPANELYIVSGPAGTGGSGSNGGTTTTLANGHVTVPSSTWKVVLMLPKASGDDVARVTASTHTLAVIMPNVQGIRNNDWHMYITTVDAVEALTGYDFFSVLPDAIENAIEGGTDGANPPGAANQAASTNEDTAKPLTLDAATPSGVLTYSILTGPFHGNLTGSGANRTYTPAPDYNGTDTFTWRVNNGTNDSNTATMTITVLEGNDPPSAANDSKVANANSFLTFPASDLTTNDSAGPANENSQTLTVSTVTPTANTHGGVVLSSGQVTYTPDPGYFGPADFTYTVCDNGVTAGVADPQCATALVNVTVNASLVTHFSVSAPSNVINGTPFMVSVTALDAGNAVVTSYTGTVHFTSSSAGTLPGDYTFVAGDNGTHAFSVTLTTNGLQTITATDTVTASINGTASTTVGSTPPPAATHFSVTAPASATTGTSFNVTVTALDAGNGTVTGYTGTVHFTSSSTGTLPGDYTFVVGDGGTKTFSVTLTQTGNQSITATDTGNASINGSANVNITCPALSVTASNNGPACTGGSVQLNASTVTPGVSFAWTGPGGFTSNQQSPSVTAPGLYTVTITGISSCTASSSTTVTFTNAPTVVITASNNACRLSGDNVASVPNAGPGATYTWSVTNGHIESGQNTNSIVYWVPANGQVTLNVSISTPGGCAGSASKTVQVLPGPGVSVPATINVCGAQNVNIPLTLTGTGPWKIFWSDGFVQTANTSSATRSYNATTTTTLGILMVTDASCSTSVPLATALTITVGTAPQITTQPQTVNVAPSGPAHFTVVATGGSLHYQWYLQDGNGIAKTVGTDSPSLTIDPAHGNMTVWVVVSNTCGSLESNHVTANITPPRRRAAGH
jgi:DNA/RNA endonuclease G (NUC1)/fibronectin type 3 domain-containing protein